ncbi:valine--tRNA ligase [Candidatus Gottesmanbacteria bacterium]|nr:valine--tRNA ligase [Candidatus Gottesmanbacteria bacterium]
MIDKIYTHQDIEQKWYKEWEENGYFKPFLNSSRTPFCIILPPPNANADLHMGHAMYVVEDILVRYHRMKGDATLWLPGADHAGFETQFVFEKQLAKKGESRFDFPRETLYTMIWDFVHTNRGKMENQLRRLGFSLDWSRQVFTLDPKVVSIVYKTFKKLYDEKLVYRSERLVNYCTRCGTGFSDLEVNYVERNDPLYFMKYGSFVIATVRPETKFRDTALAVNPKDKRYKQYIGKTFDIQGLLGVVKMTIIPDKEVDPKFGTGIMKVTPAHDPHDFELGKKFTLPVTPIIDFKGRMDFSWFIDKKGTDQKYVERAKKYHGQKVLQARKMMVEDLKTDGLLLKTDENYTHRIGICYRCGTVIEPLPMKQWFIKIQPLTQKAVRSIKEKRVTFTPKRFEKIAIKWLTNFHDWNISRQIVWGIRIPAWKCVRCAQTQKSKIKNQNEKEWIVTNGKKPEKCPTCGNTQLEQDTDTFDTWFSSGQWPVATLKVNNEKDFETFYPTSVMETGYDILPWWVCRMIMLGLYMTGKEPFKIVYLHGLIRDAKGQKMSKSKGNVVNPLQMVDTYGADALRMALIYGTAAGNDLSLSEDKIRAMRNFSNKLWNIMRFISSFSENSPSTILGERKELPKWINTLEKEILTLIKRTTTLIASYKFGQAAELLYEYIWHTFADKHIEESKRWKSPKTMEQVQKALSSTYLTCITLLHPFMPFITEEITNHLGRERSQPLIVSPWPKGDDLSTSQQF